MTSGSNNPPHWLHGQNGTGRYKLNRKPHVADNHILGYHDILAYDGWEVEHVLWTYHTMRTHIQMSHIICNLPDKRHDAVFRRMHALFRFCEHEAPGGSLPFPLVVRCN